MQQPAGHWNDEPIGQLDDDAYERSGFVERVARLIDGLPAESPSVVFGLTGAWGSGKTSVLQMIAESLREANSGWEIAQFTPWAASDLPALFDEFFAALAEAFPRADTRARRNKAGGVLRKAAPVVQNVPGVGGAAAALGQLAAERLSPTRPWTKVFQEASDAIERNGRKVLVVVDDLDRLHSEELIAVLKVVRLLGRFRNVHYLLAYDDSTVFRTLEAAEAGKHEAGWAQRFMEKIVQYPLVLPPLTETQVFEGLNSAIHAGIQASKYTDPDLDRVSEALPLMRQLLRTPRALGRFQAQLRHYLPMLPPGEANAADAILLSLVRSAFPLLYAELPYWRLELVTGHTDQIKVDASGFHAVPADFDLLWRFAPEDLRLQAVRLIARLFPETDEDLHGIRDPNPFQEKRVAHDAYFARYFSLDLKEGDVSDIEVLDAVVTASRGEGSKLMALIEGEDRTRQTLIIEKAMALDRPPGSDAAVLSLSAAMSSLSSQLTDDAGGMAHPRALARRWLVELLATLSVSADPSEVEAVVREWGMSTEQLGLLWNLRRAFSGRAAVPPWLSVVGLTYAGQAAADFLAHARGRDSADPTRIPLRQLRFAYDFGAEQLRQLIEGGIDAGEFSAEDVVVRALTTRPESDELEASTEVPLSGILPATEKGWFDRPPMDDLRSQDGDWHVRRTFVRAHRASPIEGSGLVEPD